MVIILYDLLEDFRKIIQQTEKEALIITLLSIPETPLHLGYGYYRSVILVFRLSPPLLSSSIPKP